MVKEITPEIIEQHGLNPEEYQRILKILGRAPNLTELGIFSVMWSEHCSYKSSRIHLKKFPTQGEQVLQGPGENAGVVDIGEDFALVFKMESHNHPSFIEPYQGAATGVGGILRDVFTMGARPIANLNSLRFGEPSHPKTKFLVGGVVAGIAGYGNCVGIPTVAGEVYFDSSYNQNILVNAMTVGLVRKDRIFKGVAKGVENPVIYVGSKTGRDGIHGATMASEEFDDQSEEKRPTVQVGDPFTEKLLIEACLELMEKPYLVGIQDMGAAGLTSSSFEMAARAGTGIEMDLDQVPTREEGMTSYELMLSESQERMLLVVEKGKESEAVEIFKKWDLDAAVVGHVILEKIMRIRKKGEIVAELPVEPLAHGAPLYERPLREPEYFKKLNQLDLSKIPLPKDFNPVLEKLISSPNLSSRRWVWEQYDHMVMLNTVVLPGSDAAVLRIKGTQKGVAMTTDCNSTYCYLNPRRGGEIAVAEAARNLVCSGAKPLAITDCLNFGNPEKPEVMWQFSQAIEGISEACRVFNTPVTGGNVSFYNETKGEAIHPTPTIGMLGLLENISHHQTQYFKDPGDRIFLVGETFEELGGSEYLQYLHHILEGPVPILDLQMEKSVQEMVLEAIQKGLVKSAHDLSEGGLAVALTECCVSGSPVGARCNVPLVDGGIRPDALLFGESQSRILLSVSPEKEGALLELGKGYNVKVTLLGEVGGERLRIWASNPINQPQSGVEAEAPAALPAEGATQAPMINLPVAHLKKLWEEGFQSQLSDVRDQPSGLAG